MSTFKSVVTTLGQSRIAAAIAAGTDINITQLAVGDGNGKATTPVATQTKLVKEVYRTPLNSLKLDPTHGNWVIAEAVISASVGGFWMREMGLFADDGALIAVCNMADTYKPTLAEGSGRTQTLRMVIAVSNTEAISLLIDDSVIMATEQYVNDLLAAHEKSRNHPDGTLTAKGFVQLNSSVSSTSETLAATPKAVKTANDNANTRVPSTRKVNNKALSADITLSAADVGAVSNILVNVDNATVKKIYDPSIVALTGGVTLAGFFDDHPLGATFQAADTLMTYRRWYDAGAALTQYLHCTSGTIYVRVGVVSKTDPTGWQWRQTDGVLPFGWRKLYDTANPPTASEVGALPVASAILGTANINTFNLAKIGLYVQSTGANATVANGYPAGSQAAGVLEVIPASWTGGVLQRYTVQNTGMVWTRALNASWNGKDGPWRDWVQASAVNSVNVPTSILTGTDINTLGFASGNSGTAIYSQPKNVNATAALHYPQSIAGTLYVTPSAYGCQQMYVTFTGNIWNRGLSGDWNGVDGPWKEWVPTYSANNKPTAADVGAWTAAQSAASEKALSDEIATAFKIRTNLTAADTPNTLRGSGMFGHYGVPGVAAATTDKGYPMNGFVGVIFVTWGPNATQQIAFNSNGRQFTRYATGAWNGVDGPWSAWNEMYGQANKPTAGDVGALPSGGTAVAASKLATARKISGVAFDGTKDISLNADNVGAFPRVGGDVNGRVTANYLRGISSANPGEGQGTYVGWNESGGQGESNFINNKGGGVGGFVFRIVNQANSAQTGYVRISGTGDISAQGNFYTDGGGIYEMGQRVFSPNNRQPVNANTANLGGGWWRCGDTGMIKQWGVVNKGSRGWSTVNFPIPFPNTCVNVQVTVLNGGNGTFNDNYGTAQIINNIGFTCGQDSGGSYWEATGW
ncbi:phage tail-collar fiber domain-containing protein [Rahnella variigena]|uniref:phage tail-collar fiber domain-containing protein n=1 Tax=Rahnella variigena TaxID=574964 RepID=UPI001FCA26C4|nr:phage tail protein [Rahnella variigena]